MYHVDFEANNIEKNHKVKEYLLAYLFKAIELAASCCTVIDEFYAQTMML